MNRQQKIIELTHELKKVEEVNPTEEIVVEETPVEVEEDFNLEKKVTVRTNKFFSMGAFKVSNII